MVELDRILYPGPRLFLEVSPLEEPLPNLNVLRKNGRRVGIHAATMTTFCSILEYN
jgi:hypothetical protein